MTLRLRSVLAAGLLGSGAVALAAGRPLASAAGAEAALPSAAVTGSTPGASASAQALALVVLACWGVVLVARGGFRRAVAVLGLLFSVATLAVLVAGMSTLPAAVETAYAELGADVEAGPTWWFWLALAGGLVGVVATLLAVVAVPSWPEMGRRYDAPGAEPAAPVDPAESSSTDLWRAMDEGRDPTE